LLSKKPPEDLLPVKDKIIAEADQILERQTLARLNARLPGPFIDEDKVCDFFRMFLNAMTIYR